MNPVDTLIDREDNEHRKIEIAVFSDHETFVLEVDKRYPSKHP